MEIETCHKMENGEHITYFYPKNAIYDPARDGLEVGYMIGLGVGEDGCVKRTLEMQWNGIQFGGDLFIDSLRKPESIPIATFIVRWLKHKSLEEAERNHINAQFQANLEKSIERGFEQIRFPAENAASTSESLEPPHDPLSPESIRKFIQERTIVVEPTEDDLKIDKKVKRLAEDTFWRALPNELLRALIKHEKKFRPERSPEGPAL
ncbi:MAG: hypothetical protein KGJ06_06765 [Pseudomonadota bacterium]|nr:hypothetical protein [Pseudomonadota bacterium]